MPRPVKRSVTLAGHRTSITLEEEFWDALNDIAQERNQSVSSIICELDEARALGDELASGLSSAVRLFVLQTFRDRIERAGPLQNQPEGDTP